MILQEGLQRPKGKIFLQYFKNGKLIFEHTQTNMVTNSGLLVIAGLISSSYNLYQITQFGFGTGSAPVQATDTALTGPNYRIKGLNLAGTTIYGSSSSRLAFSVDFTADIAGKNLVGTNPWPATSTITINEFGLFSVNNTMFNHLVWTGPTLTLGLGVSLSGYFQIDVLTL